MLSSINPSALELRLVCTLVRAGTRVAAMSQFFNNAAHLHEL